MVPRLVALIALGALAASCAAEGRARQSAFPRRPVVGIGFTPTSAARPRRRAPDCHVDVVLEGAPRRSYVEIGRVSASWLGRGGRAARATDSRVIRALLRAACRAGAHAIYAVRTSQEDHYAAGMSREDFARTMVASARAAVYVQPDGAMAEPPTAAERVVRRGVPPGAPAEGRRARRRRDVDDQGVLEIWGPGLEDPWAEPTR